jgi:hypothetical protein
MPVCNRRNFMVRVAVGTAALATVGRALADAPAPARQDSCGDCRFYTAAPGATTGTCAFAGKTVSADGGCGEFTPAGTAAATGGAATRS